MSEVDDALAAARTYGLPQHAPAGYMVPIMSSTSALSYEDVPMYITYFCEWCHSHAADDDSGNCSACGAPR